MNGFDFLILALVAVAVLRAVRVLARKKTDGCAGCCSCGCEAKVQNMTPVEKPQGES